MATYKEIKDTVYGKLVNKTLDIDYEDLSEFLFGEGNCYNSSEVRKRMYGMKTVIDVIENDKETAMSGDLLSELESKKIELQKERQKFFDQRNAYNKILRDRSRQEELNEILSSAVTEGNLPELNYVRESTSIITSDNDLLISLNDMHYGANIDNYWTKYNSDICAEMLEKYLNRILDIAKRHNSENAYIFCNGDAISGNIHYSISVTNKENVIEQVMGVSELISQFIANLSPYFKNVVFTSVAGNHSRINPNKDNSRVDERLDDLVEWYIKARLQNFENVIVGGGEKIDNTMYVLDIRGKAYIGVHGDYDGSSEKIQALQTMAGRPVCGVLSGHMHHNKIETIQGVKSIMAGSFLGMDDFCVQKRIYGRPEQLVCVCDSSGVQCYYDIPLKGN